MCEGFQFLQACYFFPFIPLELDQRDTEPQVASWANFENPTSSHEWMFFVGWFSNWMDEEGSNKKGGGGGGKHKGNVG